MLFLVTHAGYEGSNPCRKTLHNPQIRYLHIPPESLGTHFIV